MSVYFLCEYGISQLIAEKIDNNGIDLIDIKIQKEEILGKIWNKDSPKVKNIINATDIFFKNHSKDYISCYILLKYGLSLDACKLLISNNIRFEFLKNCTVEELIEKYKISSIICNRILEAVHLYNDNQKEFKVKERDYSSKLDKILRNLCADEFISFILLKNKISLGEEEYPVENLQQDIERLRRLGKIEFSMNGIKYVFPKFMDYVIANFDEKSAEILLDRFAGLTLEEIGAKHGVTRERIRQIIERRSKKFPKFYEDKYKLTFEKYNWNCDDFTCFYNESESTYYYLKNTYKTGSDDILQLYNENISEDQIVKLDKICRLENVLGEKIRPTRNEVLKVIIRKYAQDEISIEELSERFNNYVKSELSAYNIDLFDSRTLESVASRLNIVVFGLGKKIRYYNFDELSDYDVSKLKNIILLNEGFYSTAFLFNGNKSLMSSLDIRNEYELHNILKWRIDDDINDVEFLRMPNFIVGYQEKRQFFLDKITELSPISVNDFLDFLEKDYGHKKNTMASYIIPEFRNQIRDNIIEVSYTKLDDLSLGKIKEFLTRDVYTIKELKVILNSLGYTNTAELINNYNIPMLGYKIRSNYIMRKDIYSVDEYIRNCIINSDFFNIENKSYLKFPMFYEALNKLEKSFDLVRINDSEYITFNKLRKIGISKECLYNVREKAKEFLKKEKYVSVENVREMMNDSLLDEYGFDDAFYESIISTIDEVKVLRINNCKLFSIYGKQLSRGIFIEDVVKKYGSIEIDKLSESIKKKYDIEIPYYKIKEYVSDTNLYYNNILEKIYIDKKDFYEEVYSNE